MSAPDKDGWIEWFGAQSSPIPEKTRYAVRLRDGTESHLDDHLALRWEHTGNVGDIVAYRLAESLHAQPEPDGFAHESPIRAFTDWTVNGRYAIGKGFRPSLQHLTVYLDAMDRLEGWSLLQVLEAASGSPSFVMHKAVGASRAELIEAVTICLDAENERRANLKPGAPATSYCQKRIDRLAAILSKEPGE